MTQPVCRRREQTVGVGCTVRYRVGQKAPFSSRRVFFMQFQKYIYQVFNPPPRFFILRKKLLELLIELLEQARFSIDQRCRGGVTTLLCPFFSIYQGSKPLLPFVNGKQRGVAFCSSPPYTADCIRSQDATWFKLASTV